MVVKDRSAGPKIEARTLYDVAVEASGTSLFIFHSTEKNESVLELCSGAARMMLQELDHDDQTYTTERLFQRIEWLENEGVDLQSLEEVQQFHAFWAGMRRRGHATASELFCRYFAESFSGVVDVGFSLEPGAAVLRDRASPQNDIALETLFETSKAIRGDKDREDFLLPKGTTAVCIFEHRYSGQLTSGSEIAGAALLQSLPRPVKSKRVVRFGRRVNSYEVLDGITLGHDVHPMEVHGMPRGRRCLFLRKALPQKVRARQLVMHWG